METGATLKIANKIQDRINNLHKIETAYETFSYASAEFSKSNNRAIISETKE